MITRPPRRQDRQEKERPLSICFWQFLAPSWRSWRLGGAKWGIYANTLARLALWRANAIEETRVHYDRYAHARPGHWREHCDFQRGQCGALTRLTLSAA